MIMTRCFFIPVKLSQPAVMKLVSIQNYDFKPKH